VDTAYAIIRRLVSRLRQEVPGSSDYY